MYTVQKCVNVLYHPFALYSGRLAWDSNRRSPDPIDEMVVGRRPPVRHSPPLSRHSPPLPRHSETTEPRSSETQTSGGSVTNGNDVDDDEDADHRSVDYQRNRRRRSNGEEEEDDSKLPPAPPAVSMADSDSKNGGEIFPQNPMHRDADLMELQVGEDARKVLVMIFLKRTNIYLRLSFTESWQM